MRTSERDALNRRRSSTLHYQTFETPPPKSRGRPNSGESRSSGADHPNDESNNNESEGHSPLPKKQMAVLAMISLCEQTAFNSISPYLPEMTSQFPEAEPNMVGVYVGTLATAFAVAQFATNYFWGWLSDLSLIHI